MKLSWSNWSKRSGVVILKARKSIFILGVVFGISILGRMITGYHHKDDLDGFFRIEMPIFFYIPATILLGFLLIANIILLWIFLPQNKFTILKFLKETGERVGIGTVWGALFGFIYLATPWGSQPKEPTGTIVMFSTVAIFLSILITLFWDLAKIITTYSLDKANPILSIIFVIASLITADTLYMVWIGKEVLKNWLYAFSDPYSERIAKVFKEYIFPDTPDSLSDFANLAHDRLKDFVGTHDYYITYFIIVSSIVTIFTVLRIRCLYCTQSNHYEESAESTSPNSENNLGSLTDSIEITQNTDNSPQEETSMT